MTRVDWILRVVSQLIEGDYSSGSRSLQPWTGCDLWYSTLVFFFWCRRDEELHLCWLDDQILLDVCWLPFVHLLLLQCLASLSDARFYVQTNFCGPICITYPTTIQNVNLIQYLTKRARQYKLCFVFNTRPMRYIAGGFIRKFWVVGGIESDGSMNRGSTC